MAVSGWGVFLIILVIAILVAGAGYVFYAYYRARQLGLPPPNFNPFNRNARSTTSNYRAPAPAPGGVQGWLSDKWHSLQHAVSGGSGGGAYEGTGYGGGGVRSASDRRGFGPLDPDEAWDARVDHETSGYYEEQELGGLQDPDQGPYGGGGYVGGFGGISSADGRGRQRELDQRYDEEMHTGGGDGGGSARNPFGDDAAASHYGASLRTVSPRPAGDVKDSAASTYSGDDGRSERRSHFREDM